MCRKQQSKREVALKSRFVPAGMFDGLQGGGLRRPHAPSFLWFESKLEHWCPLVFGAVTRTRRTVAEAGGRLHHDRRRDSFPALGATVPELELV